MDGGSQIHGWLAARFFKKKAARPPGCGFFLKIPDGRLASQPCLWLPPSILGVYYWYWYIIGYIFVIMGGIFHMGGIFLFFFYLSFLGKEACATALRNRASLPLRAEMLPISLSDCHGRSFGVHACYTCLQSSSGDIHPMGPAKPKCLLKNICFYWKWVKLLSFIKISHIFALLACKAKVSWT